MDAEEVKEGEGVGGEKSDDEEEAEEETEEEMPAEGEATV